MKKEELIQKLLAKKASKMNGQVRAIPCIVRCCDAHCKVDVM